jgi:hypothetical protein
MKMDVYKAYEEQLKVTRQMVEQLVLANEKLEAILVKISEGTQKGGIEEFLGEIFGGLANTVNGQELAKELEDYGDDDYDDDDWDGDYEDYVDYEDENDHVYLIELAMNDVEELLDSPQLKTTFYGNTLYGYDPEVNIHDIHYVVDYDKGTVTASFIVDGNVLKSGVAVCHPEDVFLEATGRAIATRRLFDLDIPESLLQK